MGRKFSLRKWCLGLDLKEAWGLAVSGKEYSTKMSLSRDCAVGKILAYLRNTEKASETGAERER